MPIFRSINKLFVTLGMLSIMLYFGIILCTFSFSNNVYAGNDNLSRSARKNEGVGSATVAAEPIKVVFNFTEYASVKQDQIVAVLSFFVSGKDRVVVQKQINEKIENVMDKIKKTMDVEYKTDQYYVRKQYKTSIWEGEQSIILISKNREKMLELVSYLQTNGLTIKKLEYEFSDEKIRNATNKLIESSVTTLSDKAQILIEATKKNRYTISVFDFSTYTPIMRFDGMLGNSLKSVSRNNQDVVPEPTIEPGFENISVNVRAEILLN